MRPNEAVILDNWIPRPGYVELRRGSREHASGASDPTESLLVYRGQSSGDDEMFAAAGGDLYDVTALGSVFTSPVKTGLTNNRIQSANFANDGGAFMVCCNGADTPFRYNSSTWANLTITGTSGSITLTSSDLVDVMAHKRRLFWIEDGTLRVWYLDVDAISGTANLLDLGPVFQQGGALLCQGTWTLDSGFGPDDFACFFSNQGEVAIYQGTDPSDADNWALVGVFSIGIPLGRRAVYKFGGDLQVLTTLGVYSLSQALRLDRGQLNRVAITAKIQNAFATATQSYRDNFGWEGIVYPVGGLAIYNVPTEELTTSEQYVQTLQTGAWCRFTGMDAFCWAIANDKPYFGTDDGVYEFDQGVTDGSDDLTGDIKTAWNAFGNTGVEKQFTMIRPVLNATPDVSPAVEMLTDFQEREPVSVPVTTVMGGGDPTIRANWTGATGIGYYGAVRMQITQQLDSTLVSNLVTGGGDTVVTGGGDTVVTAAAEPVNDSVLQAINFDVIYAVGGRL